MYIPRNVAFANDDSFQKSLLALKINLCAGISLSINFIVKSLKQIHDIY